MSEEGRIVVTVEKVRKMKAISILVGALCGGLLFWLLPSGWNWAVRGGLAAVVAYLGYGAALVVCLTLPSMMALSKMRDRSGRQ